MHKSRTTNHNPTTIFRQIWIIAAAIPWLITTHTDPWTTFYNELAGCLASLPLLYWASLQTKNWRLTSSTLLLLAICTIPPLQYAAGIIYFSTDALLSACYIFSFALAYSTAENLSDNHGQVLADGLFSSILIASIASSGFAAYQWLGLDYLGVLLPSMEIGGSRAVAGVGQPNNLATLLAWGCAATWWGYSRRFFNGPVALLLAAFFLTAIALTGSRTGYIQGALIGAMFILYRPRESAHRITAIIILASWFALAIPAIRLLSDFLWGMPAREIFTTGIRPTFWLMSLEAILERPMFGYGWNQVTAAHLAMSSDHSELNTVMGHSHNLLLDLLLWNGIPIGIAISAGITSWLSRKLIKRSTEHEKILLCAILLLITHALLELPHLYLFFIIPCGLMAGLINHIDKKKHATLNSKYLIGATTAILVFALMTATDYRKIQGQLEAERFFTARITGAEPPEEAKLYVLHSLQKILNPRYLQPRSQMPASEIDEIKKIALRYPSTAYLFRYAKAAALNGRAPEAEWALQTICNIRDSSTCTEIIRTWSDLAKEGNIKDIKTPTPPAVKGS